MFKELLHRITHQNQETEIKVGPLTVKVRSRQDLLSLPLQDTEFNLRLANENGVKPLCLREVFAQIKSKKFKNTVLFDTPPSPGFAGNHWRVIGINKKQEFAILQLCGRFGNYDYGQVLPVSVPLDTPLFTGVSIQRFELDGLPATLSETARAFEMAKRSDLKYPESLKHLGETIVWSNSEGKLQKKGEPPTFQTARVPTN